MSDIYCGIGKIPKNSKLGTMKQCAEKKQIRYYGIKKIDPKTIEIAKKSSQKKRKRTTLITKISGLRGKIKNLKRKLEATKDKTKKKNNRKKFK
jgi:hypothetical protein